MPNQCGGGFYFYVVCYILVLSLALQYRKSPKLFVLVNKKWTNAQKVTSASVVKSQTNLNWNLHRRMKSCLCWVLPLCDSSTFQKMSFLNTSIMNTDMLCATSQWARALLWASVTPATISTLSCQKSALAEQTRSESMDCMPALGTGPGIKGSSFHTSNHHYVHQRQAGLVLHHAVQHTTFTWCQTTCGKEKKVPSWKTKSQKGIMHGKPQYIHAMLNHMGWLHDRASEQNAGTEFCWQSPCNASLRLKRSTHQILPSLNTGKKTIIIPKKLFDPACS